MPSKIVVLIAFLFAASAALSQETRNLTVGRGEVAAATTSQDSTDASRQLPPTVADVVLLLKSYAPDTAKTERLRAEFNKLVPEGGSTFDQAQLWHRKAYVADELGETKARLEILNKAMVYAQQSAGSSSLDEIGSLVRVRLDLVRAIFQNLGLSAGIDALEKYVADYSSSSPGVTIAPGANLTGFYLALGDVVRISAIVDA